MLRRKKPSIELDVDTELPLERSLSSPEVSESKWKFGKKKSKKLHSDDALVFERRDGDSTKEIKPETRKKSWFRRLFRFRRSRDRRMTVPSVNDSDLNYPVAKSASSTQFYVPPPREVFSVKDVMGCISSEETSSGKIPVNQEVSSRILPKEDRYDDVRVKVKTSKDAYDDLESGVPTDITDGQNMICSNKTQEEISIIKTPKKKQALISELESILVSKQTTNKAPQQELMYHNVADLRSAGQSRRRPSRPLSAESEKLEQRYGEFDEIYERTWSAENAPSRSNSGEPAALESSGYSSSIDHTSKTKKSMEQFKRSPTVPIPRRRLEDSGNVNDTTDTMEESQLANTEPHLIKSLFMFPKPKPPKRRPSLRRGSENAADLEQISEITKSQDETNTDVTTIATSEEVIDSCPLTPPTPMKRTKLPSISEAANKPQEESTLLQHLRTLRQELQQSLAAFEVAPVETDNNESTDVTTEEIANSSNDSQDLIDDKQKDPVLDNEINYAHASKLPDASEPFTRSSYKYSSFPKYISSLSKNQAQIKIFEPLKRNKSDIRLIIIKENSQNQDDANQHPKIRRRSSLPSLIDLLDTQWLAQGDELSGLDLLTKDSWTQTNERAIPSDFRNVLEQNVVTTDVIHLKEDCTEVREEEPLFDVPTVETTPTRMAISKSLDESVNTEKICDAGDQIDFGGSEVNKQFHSYSKVQAVQTEQLASLSLKTNRDMKTSNGVSTISETKTETLRRIEEMNFNDNGFDNSNVSAASYSNVEEHKLQRKAHISPKPSLQPKPKFTRQGPIRLKRLPTSLSETEAFSPQASSYKSLIAFFDKQNTESTFRRNSEPTDDFQSRTVPLRRTSERRLPTNQE